MDTSWKNTQRAPFILASGSPQRKHLLESLGIVIKIHRTDYLEHGEPGLEMNELVEQLALDKFRQCSPSLPVFHDSPWVLTADTLVFLEGQALGKPRDLQQAKDFLSLLSGNTHQVATGVCLVSPEKQQFLFSVTTDVTFSPLTDEQIRWYGKTLEWEGAAGGYRIQGAGAALVQSISGSSTNVIGLPLAEIYGILSGHKFWL